MNIDKLIQACKRYPSSNYTDEINELQAVKARMIETGSYEDSEGVVFCVSLTDCIDAVNTNMYDVYGKLMKLQVEDVSFETFKQHKNDSPCYGFGINDFTDVMLRPGYDLISDLWEENEREGSHNPDGTFKKTETVTCPDCHNDVPEGAYCMDCGCDLSWDEQDVEDSLPHDLEKDSTDEQ